MSIKRLVFTLPAVALASMVGACTAMIGWDDVKPRPLATPDTSIDVVDVASTETEDSSATEVDSGPTNFRLPARPDLPRTPSSTGRTVWYSASKVYLGQLTRLGVESKEAWKDLGIDLDGLCTTRADSLANNTTCKRIEGAPEEVMLDGNNCRDNNFGSQILNKVALYNRTFEADANASLRTGAGTLVLVLDDLDDGPNDGYVPGRIYQASPLAEGVSPKFDGTDDRPISMDSVVGGDINKPILSFPGGYLRDGVWASGDPLAIELRLPVSKYSLTIPLAGGQVMANVSADRSKLSLVTIAGAVRITKLNSILAPFAEGVGLCPGTPTYDALVRGFSQVADLVADAPNFQDLKATCDAVSFGVGFEAVPILPATSLVTTPPAPTKCK